jgi:hypothetical protein
MGRRLLAFGVLACVAIGSSAQDGSTGSPNQEQCSQDRQAWVAQALQKMEIIQPGMTRKDLLKVFTTQGGFSNRLRRTYVSHDCPYFKIDVEFEAVGRPNRDKDGRVTVVEDSRDVIVKVSRPYLQFSITD